MLRKVEDSFRALLPHENGLLVRPVVTHTITTAKKVSRKYRHLVQSSYGSLPLHNKSKKKNGEWRYKNRVGKRADEWKKVCKII